MRHSESNPGTDTQARGSWGSLFPRCLSSQTPEALSGPVIATVHQGRGGSHVRVLHYMASEIRRFSWSAQLVFFGSKERVVFVFSSHWPLYFRKSKWPIRWVAIFHVGPLSMAHEYFGVVPFQLEKSHVCFVFIFLIFICFIYLLTYFNDFFFLKSSLLSKYAWR